MYGSCGYREDLEGEGVGGGGLVEEEVREGGEEEGVSGGGGADAAGGEGCGAGPEVGETC